MHDGCIVSCSSNGVCWPVCDSTVVCAGLCVAEYSGVCLCTCSVCVCVCVCVNKVLWLNFSPSAVP